MLNIKILKKIILLLFYLLIILSLFSCTNNSIESTNINEKNAFGEVLSNINIKAFEYDVIDLEEEYDEMAAVLINFDNGTVPEGFESLVSDDGDNVIIKSGGIYKLTGTLKNKRLWVEKGLGERVQLILDGLIIDTNKYSSIRIVNDVIAQIFLANDSENVISIEVEGNPKQDAMNRTGIFSRNSLTFTGKGKLIINSNSDNVSAVESDDRIVFIKGTYQFNTKDDSLRAKNSIIFREGDFIINSGDDAIKVKNDNGGLIYLDKPNLSIKSGDKGIVSDDQVLILGGNTYIDSIGESISGKTINILDGNISLKSGDDAINSTDGKQDKKSNQTGVYTRIVGGTLDIDAKMDGIDSNGDLYLEGGHIFINGAENDNERIIDYNGKVTCGSELMFCGVGPGAKMQDFGDDPFRNYLIIYFKEPMKPSDTIRIVDESNNQIFVFTAKKTYMAALIALNELESGKTYKIIVGDKIFTHTITKGKNEIRE